MQQPKKQTPQQKRATQDSITAIKRADIVRKKDSILNREAAARGMTREENRAFLAKNAKKKEVPLEGTYTARDTKKAEKADTVAPESFISKCLPNLGGSHCPYSTEDKSGVKKEVPKRSGGRITSKKITVKKAQNGSKVTKKTIHIKPTYKNIGLANAKKTESEGAGQPATKQDSTDYKRGFNLGARGTKPSAQRTKYRDEGTYERMGRWEAQKTMKEKGYTPKKKSGGKITPKKK